MVPVVMCVIFVNYIGAFYDDVITVMRCYRGFLFYNIVFLNTDNASFKGGPHPYPGVAKTLVTKVLH